MPKASTSEVVVNGAHGEGGGALFRTALAVSALTQQPVRLHHIRGGTRKPGITSEDLCFLRAIEACTAAEILGDELDNLELTFIPKTSPRAFRGELDVGAFEQGQVPGNALMITQSLLPVLARTGAYSRFSIRGETYNPKTLTFDSFQRATLPLHSKQGLVALSQLSEAGYGFAAKGKVLIEVEPSALQGFQWDERGALRNVSCVIAYAGINSEILERAEKEVQLLAKSKGLEIGCDFIETQGPSTGIHVSMLASYAHGLGTGQAMGTRGVRVETVVRNAFEQLTTFMSSSATLDPYLADQVLVAAAFADTPTSFKTQAITARLQTMAWVIRQFVPIHITILGRPDEPGKVTINV